MAVSGDDVADSGEILERNLTGDHGLKHNTERDDDEVLAAQIRESGKFHNLLRFSKWDFDHLVNMVGPHITKYDTNKRKTISPTDLLACDTRFIKKSYTGMYAFAQFSETQFIVTGYLHS